MKRALTCQTCKGHGFISTFSYDEQGSCSGTSSCTCSNCHGVGIVYVDMTEFDRIKAMSLDEMAVYLYCFAHGNDKPLSVEEVKLYLESKWIDRGVGFKRRNRQEGDHG